MLKVSYRLKVGQDEFELNLDVKDEKQFFEQVAFYSNLPKTAPGGATDLKIVFRTTKKGHKYYSLISEIEQMEFKFGQNLEANGGGLFPKGWQKAYATDGDEDSAPQQTQAQAPLVGFAVAPKIQQTAPVQQAPIQQFVAPMPMQMQAPAPVQQAVPTPAFQPMPAATPPPAAVSTGNPAVTAIAGNVLSRFGIKN